MLSLLNVAEPSGQAPKPPKVTALVVSYNRKALLRRAIEALDASESRDLFEILVVDNGSTDTTSERLSRYVNRIRILHEDTRGAAAARNAGTRHARGELLAFTDADCVAAHDWLVNLIAPLSDRSVGISGGAIHSKERCSRIEAFGQRLYDQRAAITGSPPYAITANWASRARVLKDVGWFDESMIRGQDYDLAQRILKAGYRVAYCEEARVRISTPRTFSELFLKGIQHGHAIALVEKKDSSSTPAGTPLTTTLMRQVIRNSLRSIFGNDRFDAFCAAIFNAGKLVGKIGWAIGDARFPHGLTSHRRRRKIERTSSREPSE